MQAHICERRVRQVILDVDYTLYEKTKELDSLVWDKIEEAQISLLMEINGLERDSYESFKKKFHESGRKIGYFATFLKFGGDKKQFEELTKDVDTSEHLNYDWILFGILYLLSQKVEIFIFSGSPLVSIEKVLNVLINFQKEENKGIIKGIWGKEDSANHGLQKTDLKSFELMLEEFDIDPGEAVIIDDLRRSLDVAETLGLETIHINPEEPIQNNGDLSLQTIHQLMQLMTFS